MKKKLFAMFLSLAMLITMVPTMAFASETETATHPTIVLLKTAASESKAIKVSWSKVNNATKYVVYGNQYDKSYEQLATVTSNNYTVKKIKNTKLKAHKPYKFYVAAFSGELQLAKSNKAVCITTKTYKKYANVSKIVATKSAVELTVGETTQLGAKTTLVKKSKKHLPSIYGKTSYKTSNSSVATVSATGVVTAVGEGTATIYIQDVSGKYCTTTVTVEKMVEPTPEPAPITPPSPPSNPRVQPPTDSLTVFIWPSDSDKIIARYGYIPTPIAGEKYFHDGIDIGADYGTQIYASDSGRVIFADWDSKYGYCVKIVHSNEYSSLYGHMISIEVTNNQYVNQGDVIGHTGSSGISTRPHLHFAIFDPSGNSVDPLNLLNM